MIINTKLRAYWRLQRKTYLIPTYVLFTITTLTLVYDLLFPFSEDTREHVSNWNAVVWTWYCISYLNFVWAAPHRKDPNVLAAALIFSALLTTPFDSVLAANFLGLMMLWSNSEYGLDWIMSTPVTLGLLAGLVPMMWVVHRYFTRWVCINGLVCVLAVLSAFSITAIIYFSTTPPAVQALVSSHGLVLSRDLLST